MNEIFYQGDMQKAWPGLTYESPKQVQVSNLTSSLLQIIRMFINYFMMIKSFQYGQGREMI